MKPEMQFKQWEGRVFGYGYGSGEYPILKSLKIFFDCIGDENYDFQEIETALGDTVAWLLINALCRADMIEYGSSPRFGWLTSCGKNVKIFMQHRTADQLYDILMSDDNSDYCECNGEIKENGHEWCGKNPMINEKYADLFKGL